MPNREVSRSTRYQAITPCYSSFWLQYSTGERCSCLETVLGGDVFVEGSLSVDGCYRTLKELLRTSEGEHRLS